MDIKNEIVGISLAERLGESCCRGMMTGFSDHDGYIRDFCFTGVMVFCLCDGYKGKVSIDGKEHVLNGKHLVILPENHIIRFSEPVRDETMNTLAVTTDYILDMPSPIDTNIFGYSRYIPAMTISATKYEDFRSYFRFIDKEINEPCKYQDEIIRSILYALILEISAEYETQYDLHNGGKICSDRLSDRFFQLLAVYYREERRVQFYADKLCITPKYLSTAIKKATGRPVLDWIHEAVLIDAKMLLKSTDMTVTEVSEKLNFSCPSAFIQFFKKHVGTTPKKTGRI